MEIKASQTYIRSSQQKLRDVARVVKHLPVPALRTQLTMMNKDAAKRILETVNQAVANAQHNFGVNIEQLELKELLILRGPHYKRMRAVSRGMGHAILKRTSHISVTLITKDNSKQEAGENKKEQKEEKPNIKIEKKISVKKTTKKVADKKSTTKKTE